MTASAHTEGTFPGVGELSIFWQAWLPPGPCRGVVVIVHGAGEHSGRYPHVAARLVREGYAVYALDHRGHGRSGGPRAYIDRMDNAVTDLDTFVLRAAAEHPGLPVFLLGHSMGGMVSLCYALRHQDRLDALVLSAPLAALEAASPALRIAAKVLSALAPRLPVIAVDPSLVSRDPAVVAAYKADPLVYHGKLPARTVGEFAVAVESFPTRVPEITLPTLIMYGTADRLCPPAGSVMVGERIGSSDVTVTSYPGLYHEIFNEPEQEQVMNDMCAWLDAHVPSSAPAAAPPVA
ncbi:MAG: acylglycerol lipase [Solirubrobacteraceae bacterium]|jgi:alpha-beta hydrolase superfamily lysophospholipase|nr:acylglycerol lipase [Solirubrobacteraceae bacterium]